MPSLKKLLIIVIWFLQKIKESSISLDLVHWAFVKFAESYYRLFYYSSVPSKFYYLNGFVTRCLEYTPEGFDSVEPTNNYKLCLVIISVIAFSTALGVYLYNNWHSVNVEHGNIDTADTVAFRNLPDLLAEMQIRPFSERPEYLKLFYTLDQWVQDAGLSSYQHREIIEACVYAIYGLETDVRLQNFLGFIPEIPHEFYYIVNQIPEEQLWGILVQCQEVPEILAFVSLLS